MQGYKAATVGGKSAPPKSAPTTNGVGATNGSKKTNTSKKKSEKAANGDGDNAARAPPPGFASTHAAAAPVGFSEQQQRLLRHRALFAFRFLVGKAVEVTLVDASRYVGILDCIDPDDFSIVLKNTQRKHSEDAGAEAIGSGSTVIFKRRQLAHMAADGVVNYGDGVGGVGAKAAAGFRTDTEITNRSHDHLFGRELESAASWLDPQLDTGDLEEDARRRSSSKTNWNQFEANEKLFGVVSTFDENLYTTKLDKSKFSTEKSREAERLAREIEREATGNFHLQEERGQAVLGDEELDEEARYSSVDRKQAAANLTRSSNAYVPPALRNRPTSAGTAGAKHVSPKTSTPPPATSPQATNASKPTTPVAQAPPPQPASAAAAVPKPISFSDAVRGRSAAKPVPSQPPAAPVSAPAIKADQKPATVSPKPQATEKQQQQTSSSPKKAVSPPAAKKEAKAAAKPTAEKKPEAAKPTTDKKAAKELEKQPAPATEAPVAATAAPAKKTLNPNAREFKLSASASSFTPKFAAPSAASSPYRPPVATGHYGAHMQHAPLPHPSMGYSPMPDEWMYDGGMMVDESEYAAHAAYMGYGVPMVPNPAMMQPGMYAPMMPPPQNARVPRGAAAGYAYNQPAMYNRGYYGQQAGVPGMPPYHPGAVPVAGSGVPQPPLPPTDPSGADAPPSNAETPVKK